MAIRTDVAPRVRRGSPGAVSAWLARRWREFRLADALMVTSIPLLALMLLIGDGVVRALSYQAFDDWWTQAANMRTFVRDRTLAVANLPLRVALRRGFSPEAPDSGIIRIDVPRRAWDAMQGDPLAMWGEWVDATLSYGGTTLDVRLRKRGDNSVHWLTDKRSLTVRTSRDDPYKGHRDFALSAKDVLPMYVSNRLAQEFDVLAPTTELSPVFLNNQFYGMFRFLEVVDESFLRGAGRMPGNVFRGDTAVRGETYKSGPHLFINPYIWDRVAVNDRWTAAPPDQIRQLVVDLSGGDFESHQRLMARVDREEYARLFAYLMIVGDPYHSSGVHNQFLYEDPSTQLLHPIPWDIRPRDLTIRPAHFNLMFQALFRDPSLTDRIMAEVHRYITDGQIVAVAERLAMDAERRYGRYLEYDRLRNGLIPPVGTVESTMAFIDDNVQTLQAWLRNDQVAIAIGPPSDGLQVLDIETRGLVGVDLQALEIAEHSLEPRLFRDRNRNGRLDAGDDAIATRMSGNALVLETPLPLLASWGASPDGFDPGRMAYRLFLSGATVPESVSAARLVNRVTRETPHVEALAPGALLGEAPAWHPWRLAVGPSATSRWSGVVHLSETLRIPEGDELIVAPGTLIRLDPDVSIVSRGLVRLEGTAERPVRIEPAVAGQPWGTFSLTGSGTNGSVVRHAEFVGGGGALVDRVEYIGMINVHRAENVVFDHVRFERNVRSDDTFHALHSTVQVVDCHFVDANSDAVDFDMSRGLIRDTVFENSGGDAIDLMTSAPRIVGNRIHGAGDKGISVGEASDPVIFDTLIEGAAIGIEIKDSSEPIVLNTEIRRSAIGIGSSAKNWRYGGSGFGLVANTRLDAVEVPLHADARSRLVAAGVAGLDADAPDPAPVALDWLYRQLGVVVDELRVGLPGSWREVSPVAPVEAMRFVDDFGPVSDGWSGGSRVTRLDKRRGVLVVDAEGGAGTVSRAVDWDLTAGGGVMVLEVAGRDVRQVRVGAVGERDEVSRVVTPPADPARFAIVELSLPPDRYRNITVEIEPTPGLSHIQRSTGLSVLRAGRLSIRSVSVHAAGDGGVR